MFTRVRFAGAALLVGLQTVVCAQGPGAGQETPGDVAARVGDRTITLKEVDEAWRQSDPVEHTRARQQLYEGRRQALDRMLADLLIESAAKAKGVTPEQFAKEETARRVKPVTDADVASFYEQNKGRMQGKPLEEMRSAIRTFLEQQQQNAAREALLAELRKAGPAIRIALEPPRQAVEVAATDPARGGPRAPVVIVEFSDYQ